MENAYKKVECCGSSEIPKDLEEASEEYRQGEVDTGSDYIDDSDGDSLYRSACLADAFKAGAKWQEEKDQETIKLAEDHAFLAGADWQKEQMFKGNPVIMSVEDFQSLIDSHAKRVVEDYKEQIMKEVMEGEVHPDDCEIWVNLVGYGYKFNDGDKVRVIVCEKEEYNETGKKL